MKVNGRVLRPTTLAERRLMLSFGFPQIRVPRGNNPFIIARRLGRLAKLGCPDGQFVRDLFKRLPTPFPWPGPVPEPDTDRPVGPCRTS